MEIVRHYQMPSQLSATCEDCAGQCEVGKQCPQQDAIATDFGDLDDTRRSTEAGAGFVVALILCMLAMCFSLWLAGRTGMLQ